MRTEDELRIALRYKADQAPEPSLALLEHARTAEPRRSARPVLTIGLAVAVVAALIAVPFAFIGHRAHSQDPPINRQQPGPLSWVSIAPGLNYQHYAEAGTNEESIEIWRPSEGTFDLLDFAPSSFDPAKVTQRVPVTVAGHAGYFGKFAALPLPTAGESATEIAQQQSMFPPKSVLAWPIAADQWVVLFEQVGLHPTQATLRTTALALDVRPRTAPLRLPIKLTYLPAGWSLASVGFSNYPSRGVRPCAEIGLFNGNQRFEISLTLDPPDSSIPPVPLNRKVGRYWLELVVGEHPTRADTATGQRILDSVVVVSQPDSENDSWFPLSSVLP